MALVLWLLFELLLLLLIYDFPGRYLMSPEGGDKSSSISHQETVDLAKFLYLANKDKCDITNITVMNNITKFLSKLKEFGVGPSGQITKLTTIQRALKMMVDQIPSEGATDKQLKLVSYSTIIHTKVARIMKTLRRECSTIKKRKRDMFDTDADDHEKVLSFLGNENLLELMQSCVKKDTLTEQEQLTLRRYLMCKLVYENAQRQGAVVNMKLVELANAKMQTTSNGRKLFVYKVWGHKTSSQFGSANIVTSEEVHEILCTYVEKHRPQPQPQLREYVFLTPAGNLIAHISEDLRLLTKSFNTEYGEIKCTATKMRKLTSTHIAKQSTDEATVRRVAAHVTHSTDTAKIYYQHMQGTSDSIKAFDTITKRPAEAVPPKEKVHLKEKKPKRMWLEEEGGILKDTFSLTATSVPPGVHEAEAFLKTASYPDLFIDRTKKEVVDKCRTIIRQLKRRGECD